MLTANAGTRGPGAAREGRVPRTSSIAVATTAVNVGGFVFHVMVARTTGVALFGAVAALLGLLVVFQVPANALQVLVTRAVSERTSAQPGDDPPTIDVGPLLGGAVVWGALCCGILAALSPLIRSWLHLPTVATAALIAAYTVPVAIGIVPKSVLVGEGRYGQLSSALVVGVGVQLVLGTILVHRGLGAQGAMAAMVAGELVTSAVLVAMLATRWRTGSGGTGAEIRWREAGSPAFSYAGFWVLAVLDVVLAQHFVPGSRAGIYAAAATGAQVAFFVPGALGALAFGRFVRSGTGAWVSRLVLVRGAAAVVAVGAVVTAAVTLFAGGLVGDLYGGRYPSAAGVVGLLTAASGCLGLTSFLLQYNVGGQRRLAGAVPWLGGIVLAVAVAGSHRTPRDIAVAALFAAALTAVTMLVAALGSAPPEDQGVVAEASLALLDADLDLTIVVPYFNPGPLLATNLEQLMEVLDRSESTFEIIAVSDGSTDGSERSIEAISDNRLTRVIMPHNVGKGAALRVGLAAGRGRWLGFIDADGDLDPHLFEPFQVLTHLYSPEVILGSKRHPLSEVEYPPIRRVYSWGYQRLIHLLFRLNVGDTQTGIKLVRRDVLAAVLPRMVQKRFAFDLELFVIAQRLGYRRFLEAPVRLRHQFVSTVSIRAVRRTLVDTLGIFYRLRVLRSYDEPKAAASRESLLRFEPIVLRGSTGAVRRRPASAPLPQGRAR